MPHQFAPLPPPKRRDELRRRFASPHVAPDVARPLTFWERRVHPAKDWARSRGRAQTVVGRLGFSDENAMLISSDPETFAGVFFGAGVLVAGAVGGVALLVHHLLRSPPEARDTR
jgi:hypothetical protein